jgi:hypothetical protein
MEIKICRFCTLESRAILTLDNRKITPLRIKKRATEFGGPDHKGCENHSITSMFSGLTRMKPS